MKTKMVLLCWLLVAGAVLACQVPVFRFALERWPAIFCGDDEVIVIC